MPRGLGTVQRRILLLLMGGLALGISGSPRRYFRILKMMGREWKKIERQALQRAIASLYQSKLVSCKDNSDGSVAIVLTEKGKERALTYKLDKMIIPKPDRWDGKWRLVIFDVPESEKRVRDALRRQLKQLDFCELQKSVFVHPFPCFNEVEFWVEFYQARPYVRQIIAEWIDNELHLKKNFNLI